jgi:hypothetical protein
MNENTEITIVEGQQDLFTGEVVETTPEETELTVEDIVKELTSEVFGNETVITAYKIHNIINGAFKVLGIAKVVPPQMMYNYDRNGLIVKGKKGVKRYTADEVYAFVTKYVNKYI